MYYDFSVYRQPICSDNAVFQLKHLTLSYLTLSACLVQWALVTLQLSITMKKNVFSFEIFHVYVCKKLRLQQTVCKQ